MKISCNTIVDRRDHVQYLTVILKSLYRTCRCTRKVNIILYSILVWNWGNKQGSVNPNVTFDSERY